MKKIICAAALLLALAFGLSACGDAPDYKYTYAWIALEGEDIAEGYVTRCELYNSGVVGLTIDGRRYRTSWENVVLVEMPEALKTEAEARTC